jgi:hypothetical protein
MYLITHLCNHILLQSGGGTWGTSLYTVRGVGSGSRDVDVWWVNVTVHRGSGSPSTDDPGAWQHCGDSTLCHSVPRLVRPDPRVRQRISDRCDPVIRVDHTDFFKWQLKLIQSLCDRDTIGVSSIFKGIRRTSGLTRILTILDLSWVENVTRWKWNWSLVGWTIWTPESGKKKGQLEKLDIPCGWISNVTGYVWPFVYGHIETDEMCHVNCLLIHLRLMLIIVKDWWKDR